MRVTFGVSATSKSRNRSSRDDKSLDTIDPIENELRRMAGNSQAQTGDSPRLGCCAR